MFTLSHTAIINIHKDSVDMRLGVHSLQGLIAGSGYSVREGAHYAFTNRSRTLLRTVWFNGTGLCMFSKRLERGVFSWPREASPGGGAWEGIQPSAFGLLLERMGLHRLSRPPGSRTCCVSCPPTTSPCRKQPPAKECRLKGGYPRQSTRLLV